MTENKRFRIVNHDEFDYELDYIMDNYKRIYISDVCDLLNNFNEENVELLKDNFELQGLLGDVRALLRLGKVDDAISRIDKFERSMKK